MSGESFRTDVVVVGGGLFGCATAYYLAKRGASVLLVEKGELNRQASGQNAGSLHFQLEYREIAYGDEVARRFATHIPLNLAAIKAWAGLEQELDADLEVVQEGGLMVAESPEDVEVLRRKQALEQSAGLTTQLLTGDEARALCPVLSPNVQAAAFCPDEGHANPRHVAPAFARGALRLGAQIRTGAGVTAITRSEGRWHLGLADGARVEAEAVVNAAGAWAGDLAAMVQYYLPVVPLALHMNATIKTEPMLKFLVQHVSRRLSLKQVRDGNVLIGGGWPSRFAVSATGYQKDAAPSILPDSVTGNLSTACQVVPSLRHLHLLRTWSGVVAVTVDNVPLLGEIPSRPGFFVGAGGSAFTLGPVYASLLAELIMTGQTSLDITEYSPARFDHVNLA